MPAPSVAVTTLAAPTGFGGVLQAGGSIPIGEQRWYTVVAIDAFIGTSAKKHSPPSIEIGPFTADATNRKIALSWGAVAGAAGYRVHARSSAFPNPSYNETVPNALGTSPATSFTTTTSALTFTDQIAAINCKRPFFGVGLPLCILTAGDSGTPGTFRSFYDALIAASLAANAQPLIPASFVPDITGNYFAVAAYLQIGDGATATYFEAKDTCLFLVGALKTLGTNLTLVLGEYDPTTGRRSRGCAIYAAGYGSATESVQVNRFVLFAATQAELNDSYIEDLGRRGVVLVTGNGGNSIGMDGGMRVGDDASGALIALRGTELSGWSVSTNISGDIIPSEIQDLYVRSVLQPLLYSTGATLLTVQNLTVEGCTVGLFAKVGNTAPGAGQRYIGLKVRGRTEADMAIQAAVVPNAFILRDPSFDAADDEDPLWKQGSTVAGCTLQYESLVEVEVVDPNGSPVVGAAVSVVDVTGTTLASGVTDGAGVVVGGMAVSYVVYENLVTGTLAAALMSAHVAAAKWSKIDRRPLRLQVLAAGFEPFGLKFSPIGSVAYRIPLHPDSACRLDATVRPVEVKATAGPLSLRATAGTVIPLTAVVQPTDLGAEVDT